MNVVVVGAGIVGASVAYRLAAGGASVRLFEQRYPASGTSSTSFAWTNANNKEPWTYHALNVAGMGEHLSLAREFDAAPWVHQSGNAEWSTADTPGLLKKVDRLREGGYPAELYSRQEFRALEPELAPPAGVDTIAVYPTEGWIAVPLLIATLLDRFTALGGRVHSFSRVDGLDVTAGKVSAISIDGERIATTSVVSCVGRWTAEFLALAGIDVPMAPTTSVLVTSSIVPTRLRMMINTPEINLRPDGSGRILLQSTEFDCLGSVTDLLEQRPEITRRTFERAKAVLPALAGGVVESAVAAVRSIPGDGLPIVGPVPAIGGLYAIVTHSAVTLGPLLGRLATRELLDARTDGRLAPFRPGRSMTASS